MRKWQIETEYYGADQHVPVVPWWRAQIRRGGDVLATVEGASSEDQAVLMALRLVIERMELEI